MKNLGIMIQLAVKTHPFDWFDIWVEWMSQDEEFADLTLSERIELYGEGKPRWDEWCAIINHPVAVLMRRIAWPVHLLFHDVWLIRRKMGIKL